MKNQYFFLVLLCLLITTATHGQQNSNIQQPTSINKDGSPPDESAILDVNSSDQGVLISRLTTTQRASISNPAKGLVVYDIDTKSFWYFEGSTWKELSTKVEVSGGQEVVSGDSIPPCDVTVYDTIHIEKPLDVDSNTVIEICFDISHTWIGDLEIDLISPDKDTFDLVNGICGNCDDFVNTCFSTNATTSIYGGTHPYTGNFLPEDPFSALVGKQIMGDWILRIFDNTCADGGTLNSWSISFSSNTDITSSISDEDCDTKIQVEESMDEDMIRFDIAGQQAALIDSACRLGIGKSFPQGYPERQIHVAGPEQQSIFLQSSSGEASIELMSDNFALSKIYAPGGTDDLRFWQEVGQDVMTIKQNGYVGIGTTNPAFKLHIESQDTFGYAGVIRLNSPNMASNAETVLQFGKDPGFGNQAELRFKWLADNDPLNRYEFGFSNIAPFMFITRGQRVGIGRLPTTNRLEVDGEASKSSAGDWIANSDMRLKKNIKALDPEATLERLLELQGVTYEWNDEKTGNTRPEGELYGFTAQNIQEAYPSLVSEDADGFLQTAYGTYDAMTVEAIRALLNKIEALQNENEELKETVSTQEGSLNDLSQKIEKLETAVFGTAKD